MASAQEVGEIFGEGTGPAQAMLRSPTVIIASIGLWGMNVYFFRLFKIDYVKVLNLDLVKEREAKMLAESGTESCIRRKDAATNGSSSGSRADDDVKSLSKVSDIDLEDDVNNGAEAKSAVPYGTRITWWKLVGLSVFLNVVLHLIEKVWVESMGHSIISAVFVFYAAFAIAVMFPFPSTRWLRSATVLVLQRTYELVNPRCSCITQEPKGPRPIPFIDVFYADAMCSLSKVFFDWGMLWHLASHYPDPVPKSVHSILIPSFCSAIPYMIRARQCLIMYTVTRIKSDRKRFEHIANAIKYSTSIFPICLSAYQQTLPAEKAAKVEGFLIFLFIINSLYSLTWDIVKDWGMMQNPSAVVEHTISCGAPMSEDARSSSCGQAVLRRSLRFGVLASSGILAADTVLRFSWLLRFHEGWFPSKDHFVLASQLLEAFRRGIWNLLRVEWENIKQNKSKPNSSEEEMIPFIKS